MTTRFPPLLLVLGVGEIASAVAHRLFLARFRVVMTEGRGDLDLRRYTSFSRVFTEGQCEVEGVSARVAVVTETLSLIERGSLPVLSVDARSAVDALNPEIVVDCREEPRLSETPEMIENIHVGDVSLIIAAKSSFSMGDDCDMAVLVGRGHNMGRPVTSAYGKISDSDQTVQGDAVPDPVLAVPARSVGMFSPMKNIGDVVVAGDVVGKVDGNPLETASPGVVKGILEAGTAVGPGITAFEIDTRGMAEYVFAISDQGRAVSGTVLEMAVSWSVDVGALAVPVPYPPFERG
jgi:xanthine dehydrogenase accessory factor